MKKLGILDNSFYIWQKKELLETNFPEKISALLKVPVAWFIDNNPYPNVKGTGSITKIEEQKEVVDYLKNEIDSKNEVISTQKELIKQSKKLP
jgi:hypothetical protein